MEAQRGPDLDSADLFFCFLERPSGTRSINDRIPAESEPHVTNAHNATVQPQHITQKWDRHASIDTQKRKKKSSDDSSADTSDLLRRQTIKRQRRRWGLGTASALTHSDTQTGTTAPAFTCRRRSWQQPFVQVHSSTSAQIPQRNDFWLKLHYKNQLGQLDVLSRSSMYTFQEWIREKTAGIWRTDFFNFTTPCEYAIIYLCST